ncbi:MULTISPECIES: hypothetical protein [Natrialbaceae]|uniref:hypothetical protein n=1 Tax=Natrialbaceae TaxID=1644061 RepID=UPI00207CE029|nr:hypothetical protein [Natronococcus sp. CG52]
MGTGGGGERCRSEHSIVWVDPDELSRSTESTARDADDGEPDLENDRIDLEFEWFQLCHACGEQKWFRAMICDDCRGRYGVSWR